MTKAYIVSAKRTAVGTLGGSLENTAATDLGVAVVKNMLEETKIKPEDVNELIFGNVLSAGLGQNVSRQILLKSGIPIDVPAFSINKVCGSGMKAVHLAFQSILSGDSDVVIAGGTENMNQSPYIVKKVRSGLRMGNSVLEDSIINDGLWCAINDYHMGVTAENIANKYGITRQEQDEFAYRSQQKAAEAIKSGAFKEEIVPLEIKKGKELVNFDTDEHPRLTSLEKMAALKPAFKKDGTVTAGNASGINDGAAAMIIASEKYVKKNNIKPLAEIVNFASVGVNPEIMGIGPALSINKLLTKAGINLKNIDIFELNEAFAAQVLAVLKDTGINPELVNVNGGAISLGHPIGASGARIIVSLLHLMKKRNLKLGLASLCIGGGMGISMILKRNFE